MSDETRDYDRSAEACLERIVEEIAKLMARVSAVEAEQRLGRLVDRLKDADAWSVECDEAGGTEGRDREPRQVTTGEIEAAWMRARLSLLEAVEESADEQQAAGFARAYRELTC